MKRKERIVAIGKPNNDITYDWETLPIDKQIDIGEIKKVEEEEK